MKQLLFTLTKPEMAEIYNRYSAKAPEPLSAQFDDRVDKESAVKAYKEKCGKRNKIQLFPTGTEPFCQCSLGVAFLLILPSDNSLLANLLKKSKHFTCVHSNQSGRGLLGV